MGIPSRFAVMGNPIAHSLSPIIHRLFAEQTGCVLTYEKLHIDLPDFERQVELFFQTGGRGLNITQPFKQRAFSLSQDKTARCIIAGAANTLWRNEAGRLQADNTDGVGLLRDLTRYIDLAGSRMLLLGAGGAARGILVPLLGARPESLTIANRTHETARTLCESLDSAGPLYPEDQPILTACEMADLHGPYDLILNATSANLTALPPTLILPTTVCYDLRYQQQSNTPFVTWARAQGGVGIDGLGMLVEQAAEAFNIWHGVMPDVDSVRRHLI